MRPFEGIKILDCTHVLAAPFTTYQMALLGADVVKVEDPTDPDQSRVTGTDMALNKDRMGTNFLTQGANKRSVAIDLKSEGGRKAFKALVEKWADVLVEGYRPGAFNALGLSYKELSALNPKLIYISMSAFGQEGPRSEQTAYDQAIQAISGITACTGSEESGPIRAGAPIIDYATGTMGAFALSAALYQRLRTGKGQHVDMAMFNVALMLQGSYITSYLYSGQHPKRAGNKMRFAESCLFEAKDGGLIQLAASNARQHTRFYEAISEPEEAARSDLDNRYSRYDEKYNTIARKMKEKTADEWETYLQSKHVPAGRVRELREAVQDPQLKHRNALHKFERVPGVPKEVTVPVAAFSFAEDGPKITHPPATFGQHTSEVLQSVGYTEQEIETLRRQKAIA